MMIAANSAAFLLLQPHPLWLRLYGSFAAPLFILISGMMVAYTARTEGHNLRHFSVRGAKVILVGVLVDLTIWRIYPFTTVDVLYLIGVSIPLAYLFLRLRPAIQWVIIIAILAATPLLQIALGYADYPTEFNLLGQQTFIVSNQMGVLNHWLVDGWFPVFPWLGFSFLGATLANIRWSSNSKDSFGGTGFLVAGLGLLVVGILVWLIFPGSLLVRAGYSELFYPPSIGYALTAIGLIVVLFTLVGWTSSSAICKPLSVVGESSLFIYVLHLALIEYVIYPFLAQQYIQAFSATYVALLVVVALLAYGLRAVKEKREPI